MSARYTDEAAKVIAQPIQKAVQVTLTAAELFVIRTALESASYNAADEAKDHRSWSRNSALTLLDRSVAQMAAVEAETRTREYAALAMRLGQQAPELGRTELPAGWTNFPTDPSK